MDLVEWLIEPVQNFSFPMKHKIEESKKTTNNMCVACT